LVVVTIMGAPRFAHEWRMANSEWNSSIRYSPLAIPATR
jgi:hypothetical protein